MADDQVFEEEPAEDELPDPELEEEDLDDELGEELVDEEGFGTDDEAVVVVEGEAEEEAEEAAPRGRKRREEAEEDDEEEFDLDDVEADLDTILKDRIAAGDDEADEELEDEVDTRVAEAPDGVTPKRANEFVCTGCFLLVNRGQFGPLDNLQCPVGEADCPAIAEILRTSGP
ncbi:MAG: hypothetical protein MUF83_20055 [Acidimicrobiales bacterium]|jgi:hypothetical protein|nr:hypothetical protein [Acidimicrobiales bacterium]